MLSRNVRKKNQNFKSSLWDERCYNLRMQIYLRTQIAYNNKAPLYVYNIHQYNNISENIYCTGPKSKPCLFLIRLHVKQRGEEREEEKKKKIREFKWDKQHRHIHSSSHIFIFSHWRGEGGYWTHDRQTAKTFKPGKGRSLGTRRGHRVGWSRPPWSGEPVAVWWLPPWTLPLCTRAHKQTHTHICLNSICFMMSFTQVCPKTGLRAGHGTPHEWPMTYSLRFFHFCDIWWRSTVVSIIVYFMYFS